MPFFSRNKKPVAKEGPRPTVKPPERVLPVVDFKTTKFGDIEPGHMQIFLTAAFGDPDMVAKRLVIAAYHMNEMFVRLASGMFDHPMTFSQLKTALDNMVNTGTVRFEGEEEHLTMEERGMFAESMQAYSLLEGCYKDINKRSRMYFAGGTDE